MIIAIDGATRRPGAPDCISVGGVFIKDINDVNHLSCTYEEESTSQRGEMNALNNALVKAVAIANATNDNQVYIITDSEYLFNAITKDWISNWKNKGWLTAMEEPVKNQDIWKSIDKSLVANDIAGNEIMIYHIKGHLVSLGKVTARKLLYADPSGEELKEAVENKYSIVEATKTERFNAARTLFRGNHGFDIPEEQFRKFVVYNTVVDYIAGTYADDIIAREAPTG